MTLKLRNIFSVNDPGWGNSHNGKDSKDSAGDQPAESPNTEPVNPDVPVEAAPDRQPNNAPKTPGGPPDLDDLWRDFNDRIGSLFGGNKKPSSGSRKPYSTDIPPPGERGNGGGGGGGGGNNVPNFNFTNPFAAKSTAILAVGGVILMWLASGFFIVQEGQAGVIMTFGKYDYTAGPGINWRMPWPVQAQEIVNVSGVRSVEVGRPILIKATNQKDSSMLTEDENIIDVRFAVQYRLKDATDYLFNDRDPDAAVVLAAETAVREIVARSKMDTVLYEGREKIGIDLAISIQSILDIYSTGIFITSVTVQNVQPPEQVQAAFDDAVKAGQDQERLKSEGQAYANDIIPRASGTAARLIQEAEGYKARVTATAQGDATRFKQVYAEYAKAPGVTRDRMYIDTMREMYNNVTKILVDTSKSNNLLYLPLDKIAAQVSTESAQAAAQATSGTPNGTVTVGGSTGSSSAVPTDNSTFNRPSGNINSMDGLRSRDRGAR
uniref:FtsH protease activity modulator HflK n=1 Tax=Polynucleobacter sp. TaxID=2029855 RepID=UPI004047C7CE